jgi:sugar phosphate isomerase/epimerase
MNVVARMQHVAITRRRFLAAAATSAAALALPHWLRSAPSETNSTIELGVNRSFGDAGILKQAGFQYIEENVGRVLMPLASDEEFAKRLLEIKAAALPVKACSGFIPGDIKIVGTNVALEPLAKYVTVAFRRAAQVGVNRIVLGSGKSRQIPEGFSRERATEQLVEFGKLIGPLAQPHGVIVVLEQLNKKECNFINRVDEGLAIVEAVGHPNFQQHADIYHMLREAEGPESIVKAGPRLRHCHIATKNSRKAPGVEDDDFRPYFKALKSIGYHGGISIESGWKDIAAELPKAYRVLREQWDSA